MQHLCSGCGIDYNYGEVVEDDDEPRPVFGGYPAEDPVGTHDPRQIEWTDVVQIGYVESFEAAANRFEPAANQGHEDRIVGPKPKDVDGRTHADVDGFPLEAAGQRHV